VAGFAAVSPRVLASVVLLVLAVPSLDAAAQRDVAATVTDAGVAHASEAAAATDGDVEVDPVSGRRYRRVRPDGLERGALTVDRWVPVSIAALLAGLAGVVLVRGMRRKRS
jgi:hypothetical protein